MKRSKSAGLMPAIEGLRQRRTKVADLHRHDAIRSGEARALAAGADWINDISAGQGDPAMLPAAAAAGAPIILMHMQGRPATMQKNPTYSDVTGEVRQFLQSRLAAAEAAGIPRRRILLDPGIGFGKSADHSLTLLRDLARLADIGRPLVVGASRKSFIGKILGEPDPLRRGVGDAAVISWAVANRAAVLRVHDVAAAAQVLRVTGAVMRGAMP
jgi:dihydropteroate synthase